MNKETKILTKNCNQCGRRLVTDGQEVWCAVNWCPKQKINRKEQNKNSLHKPRSK